MIEIILGGISKYIRVKILILLLMNLMTLMKKVLLSRKFMLWSQVLSIRNIYSLVIRLRHGDLFDRRVFEDRKIVLFFLFT